MKKGKVLLLSFLLMVFIFSVAYLSASTNKCGCDETYMGQPLTAYKCAIVGGQVQWRICYYGGAENL